MPGTWRQAKPSDDGSGEGHTSHQSDALSPWSTTCKRSLPTHNPVSGFVRNGQGEHLPAISRPQKPPHLRLVKTGVFLLPALTVIRRYVGYHNRPCATDRSCDESPRPLPRSMDYLIDLCEERANARWDGQTPIITAHDLLCVIGTQCNFVPGMLRFVTFQFLDLPLTTPAWSDVADAFVLLQPLEYMAHAADGRIKGVGNLRGGCRRVVPKILQHVILRCLCVVGTAIRAVLRCRSTGLCTRIVTMRLDETLGDGTSRASRLCPHECKRTPRLSGA